MSCNKSPQQVSGKTISLGIDHLKVVDRSFAEHAQLISISSILIDVSGSDKSSAPYCFFELLY